jgi:hypothetical protein
MNCTLHHSPQLFISTISRIAKCPKCCNHLQPSLANLLWQPRQRCTSGLFPAMACLRRYSFHRFLRPCATDSLPHNHNHDLFSSCSCSSSRPKESNQHAEQGYRGANAVHSVGSLVVHCPAPRIRQQDKEATVGRIHAPERCSWLRMCYDCRRGMLLGV